MYAAIYRAISPSISPWSIYAGCKRVYSKCWCNARRLWLNVSAFCQIGRQNFLARAIRTFLCQKFEIPDVFFSATKERSKQSRNESQEYSIHRRALQVWNVWEIGSSLVLQSSLRLEQWRMERHMDSFKVPLRQIFVSKLLITDKIRQRPIF